MCIYIFRILSGFLHRILTHNSYQFRDLSDDKKADLGDDKKAMFMDKVVSQFK